MIKNSIEKNGILLKILQFFPKEVSFAIENAVYEGDRVESDLFEIRLRVGGRSSLIFNTGSVVLPFILKEEDMHAIVERLTSGALYAHRDTLTEGYVIPFCGMRVGVCSRVRYDGGRAVGVSDISSLVFRIPSGKCSFADEIYSAWKRSGQGGMLIYSPPCGGKTTALKDLVLKIGESGVRVCVVDERCEFISDDYKDAEVDILRGYKKQSGIEIAVRTLGAEVVAVDEIGIEEAKATLPSLTLGVPFIATAHARSLKEILTRPAFKPFLDAGIFSVIVGIKRSGGVWRIEENHLKEKAIVGEVML